MSWCNEEKQQKNKSYTCLRNEVRIACTHTHTSSIPYLYVNPFRITHTHNSSATIKIVVSFYCTVAVHIHERWSISMAEEMCMCVYGLSLGIEVHCGLSKHEHSFIMEIIGYTISNNY